MPYAYTTRWMIDDGSAEQEAYALVPLGCKVIRQDRIYYDIPRSYRLLKGIPLGTQEFCVKVEYSDPNVEEINIALEKIGVPTKDN